LVPSPISVAPTWPVDAGVGLDIDAAARRTGLTGGFFPVAGLVFCEAKAVGAHDGAIFEGDVVAEDAVFTDDGVGVCEEVIAGLNAG